MEENATIGSAFDLGSWLGRKQAFGLIAGRCSVADAECLSEIKDKRLHHALGETWEEFCKGHLGISRAFADKIIRQYKQLGPNFTKLNSFTRIKPAEYRLIAAAVTEEGVTYDGQVIPMDAENAPKLTEAVEALRREYAPEPAPADPIGQSFAKAEKWLESAVAEFCHLQSMNLDDDGRLKLLVAVETGRDDLEQIRTSTEL